MSFPSVLYHDGDWYMTPERHNARMLRVYRATAFPTDGSRSSTWRGAASTTLYCARPSAASRYGRQKRTCSMSSRRSISRARGADTHARRAVPALGRQLHRRHTPDPRHRAGLWPRDQVSSRGRGRPHDRADVVSKPHRHAHFQRVRNPCGDRRPHRAGRSARSRSCKTAAAATRTALASRADGQVRQAASRRPFKAPASPMRRLGSSQMTKPKVILTQLAIARRYRDR